MPHKMKLTLTDEQWDELKRRAVEKRTNPATMVKRMLFPKSGKAVEKRETPVPSGREVIYSEERENPVVAHEAVFENGRAVAKPLRISDIVTEPVDNCSFCDNSRRVWLNGDEIPCPRCG